MMGKAPVSGGAQWVGISFHRFPWESRVSQVDALISKQQLSSAGFCGNPETLAVVWQKPRFLGSKRKLTFRWDPSLKEELNHHSGYRRTLSESEKPFGQRRTATSSSQSGNPSGSGSFCYSQVIHWLITGVQLYSQGSAWNQSLPHFELVKKRGNRNLAEIPINIQISVDRDMIWLLYLIDSSR